MTQALWTEIDDWLERRLCLSDPALAEALRASDAAGLQPIAVAPNQGKLLNLMARMCSARTILEIGTLGGYSTLWLARALPPDGKLVTLEVDPLAAATARASFERAGLSDRIELRIGPALDSLQALEAAGAAPFDLVFIDADKESYPAYLERVLRLTRRGAVIVADNVIRGGAVTREDADARAAGARRFLEQAVSEPRLDTTAIQTVGSKGHDGFSVTLVTADPEAPA